MSRESFLHLASLMTVALRLVTVPPLPTTLRRLRGGPADGRSAGIPGRLKIANRGVLAGALVRTCLAQHSGSVQFHFEQAREGRGDHSMGAPAQQAQRELRHAAPQPVAASQRASCCPAFLVTAAAPCCPASKPPTPRLPSFPTGAPPI